MNFLSGQWIREQYKTLPYPTQSCAGKTIVVTGANVGLGLEAARHFTRLDAAKVILACRSAEKGEAAKKDIESTTGRTGVVDVWELDLESYDSVKEFIRRAGELERLDIVVENAGIAISFWKEAEGRESTVTVNVISTILLAMGLLPVMRRTATKFNVQTNLVIVSSDACAMAKFEERKSPNIYRALQENKDISDRYSTSKLLQIILTKRLAEAVSAEHGVTINCLNPGLCKTTLFRHMPFVFAVIFGAIVLLFARTAEMGSRNLMSAAFAGPETHGRYMSSCEVYKFPEIMDGEEGEVMGERVWRETLEILEGIEPGVTKVVA